MRVRLLGTGAADGWPNPFCGCASCAWARTAGTVRGQSAALVDCTLLLDCGPEVPRAAERLGEPLTDVRHVLLTHAHPDHTGPAALMWRGWVERDRPLDVWGPPAAVEACRGWLAPGDPVSLHEVRPGDELRVGAYAVRALPANHGDASVGPAVLYDVTGPDGARLLYATDTGPLPDAAVVAGARYDLVLLELAYGRDDGTAVGHLDLRTWPEQVARLRAAGAVGAATQVAPTHLGHRNPPGPELAGRLAAWGAQLHDDGALLQLGGASPGAAGAARTPGPAVAAPARRTLVTGGARSGKSAYAEDLLRAEPHVTYAATSGPRDGDPEWAARVRAHRERRPTGWPTVEVEDLPRLVRETEGAVLVDCLTLWLAGVMDRLGAWDGDGPASGTWRGDGPASGTWRGEVDALLAAWRGTRARVVAVTNEVGSGVVPSTPSGRLFRDALGELNARVAAECEQVVLVTAGVAARLR